MSKGVHQVLLTDTVNLNHAGTGPKVIGEDCWGEVWTSVGGEVRVAEDQMWMFTDGNGEVLPHGSAQRLIMPVGEDYRPIGLVMHGKKPRKGEEPEDPVVKVGLTRLSGADECVVQSLLKDKTDEWSPWGTSCTNYGTVQDDPEKPDERVLVNFPNFRIKPGNVPGKVAMYPAQAEVKMFEMRDGEKVEVWQGKKRKEANVFIYHLGLRYRQADTQWHGRNDGDNPWWYFSGPHYTKENKFEYIGAGLPKSSRKKPIKVVILDKNGHPTVPEYLPLSNDWDKDNLKFTGRFRTSYLDPSLSPFTIELRIENNKGQTLLPAVSLPFSVKSRTIWIRDVLYRDKDDPTTSYGDRAYLDLIGNPSAAFGRNQKG